MTNKNIIIKYLQNHKDKWVCDDCLSKKTDITPRQQINQIANRLRSNNIIKRRKSVCSFCGKKKKSSSFKSMKSGEEKVDEKSGSLPEEDSIRESSERTNLFQKAKRAFKAGKKLKEAFEAGPGIFGHTEMPETDPPEGVKEGSYEHIMFITMTVSIDYMRDAEQLWEASRKTFEDEKTNWIFYPDKVVKRGKEELKDAMKKYDLSRKPNKDSKKIWFPIAKTFTKYGGDPTNLFEECNYDAKKLYKKVKGPLKGRFPYLSGSKILPTWIRILFDQAGIEFKNMNEIPIPVDRHIARSTFTLGALQGRYSGSISDVKSLINDVWKTACEGTEYYPLQFDEMLWRLSKEGCSQRENQSCSLKHKCPAGNFCVDGKVSVSSTEVVIDTGDHSLDKIEDIDKQNYGRRIYSPKSQSEEIESNTFQSKPHLDPEDVLVLIPCCAEKEVTQDYFDSEKSINEFLSEESKSLLNEGRNECSEDLVKESKPIQIQAFGRYNGNLYSSSLQFEHPPSGVSKNCRFKSVVSNMIKDKGMHLLIVSASYGLLRPEERIKDYNKKMGERISTWRYRIPKILADYISENDIQAVYGFFGRTTPYKKIIEKTEWSSLDVKEVKLFYPINYTGGPQRTVPTLSGKGVISLILFDFNSEEMIKEFKKGKLDFDSVI